MKGNRNRDKLEDRLYEYLMQCSYVHMSQDAEIFMEMEDYEAAINCWLYCFLVYGKAIHHEPAALREKNESRKEA